MDERLQFVARRLAGEAMAELCREFGISRKTGYKIFDRYRECGVQGLTDRSRRPYRYAHQLPFQVENFILNVRSMHAQCLTRLDLSCSPNYSDLSWFNDELKVRERNSWRLEILARMLTIVAGIIERRLTPVNHDDVNLRNASSSIPKSRSGKSHRHR